MAQSSGLSEQQKGWVALAEREEFATPAACVGLSADVDERHLTNAWEQVCARHSSLRTRFTAREGRWLQSDDGDVPALRVVDATSWSEDDLRTELERVDPRLFDLGRGGLAGVDVYRRGPRDTVTRLRVNHIVADMSSADLICFELVSFYLSAMAGVPLRLTKAKHSYLDYVAQQRVLLQSRELQEMRAWWKDELAGVVGGPVVGGVVPATHEEGNLGFTIDRELAATLRALRPRLFRTMFSIQAILLASLSGATDIVMGTAGDTRPLPTFSDVVGDFANVLPIRTRVDPMDTFAGVYERVDAKLAALSRRRAVPFSIVAEGLGVPADGSSLFRSYIALVTLSRIPPLTGVGLDTDWRTELVGVPARSVRFPRQPDGDDLGFWMAVLDDRIVGEMKFNRRLFDAGAARRVADAFVGVCRAVVGDPNVTAREISDRVGGSVRAPSGA